MLLKKIYITDLSTEFGGIFQNIFFINEWFFIDELVTLPLVDGWLIG